MFRFTVKVVDTFSRRERRVRRGLIIKSLRPLRSLRDLFNLEPMLRSQKVSTAILNMPNIYIIFLIKKQKAQEQNSCAFPRNIFLKN